jgi:hypothetical protein
LNQSCAEKGSHMIWALAQLTKMGARERVYRERAIIIDDRLHIICIANLWVDTSFYSGSIVDVFAIWSGRRRYVFIPTAVRSSHPRKCSDRLLWSMLLLLPCSVLFATFQARCVVLGIVALCVCGVLLDDALSSSRHNLICLVANIF